MDNHRSFSEIIAFARCNRDQGATELQAKVTFPRGLQSKLVLRKGSGSLPLLKSEMFQFKKKKKKVYSSSQSMKPLRAPRKSRTASI